MSLSIPPEVARHLDYYVYLYVDPRDDRVFYVGKGQGARALAHLSAEGEARKAKVLEELKQQGLEPRIDILAHKLPNEETAFRVEAAIIDFVGLGELTNEIRGWRSVQSGRMPLSELVIYYAAKPVEVIDPVLLIRINRLYRHAMSGTELYEITRGVWKLGKRRNNAQYALSVFEGVVREVYAIEAWHEAGTLLYSTRPMEHVQRPGRWEFSGEVAPEPVRSRYLHRSVAAYFKRGTQNPLVYVNV